ncbi:hypothetical protein PENTCL1PPCAC_14165, partial [Pristionchus entomophagus]
NIVVSHGTSEIPSFVDHFPQRTIGSKIHAIGIIEKSDIDLIPCRASNGICAVRKHPICKSNSIKVGVPRRAAGNARHCSCARNDNPVFSPLPFRAHRHSFLKQIGCVTHVRAIFASHLPVRGIRRLV